VPKLLLYIMVVKVDEIGMKTMGSNFSTWGGTYLMWGCDFLHKVQYLFNMRECVLFKKISTWGTLLFSKWGVNFSTWGTFTCMRDVPFSKWGGDFSTWGTFSTWGSGFYYEVPYQHKVVTFNMRWLFNMR